MENLNPTTETYSSQEAKEGREYIIKKDGKGGEHKLINLAWEGHAPFTGIVEIIPLKIAKGYNNAIRHQNEVKFSTFTDKVTGMRVGVPNPGYDKDGQLTFKRLSVSGAEFLDLAIRTDRERWICIKYSSFLKGSPNFLMSSKTVYEAVDKERDNKNYFLARKLRIKAGEIAGTLWGEELIDMGLALGFDPKTMSTDTLSRLVIEFAENAEKDRVTRKTGSERFMEIYGSETRLELTILKRGLSTGVLAETVKDGINYNGLTLGFNESEAVRYLREHPSTKTSIDIQSRQIQNTSTQTHAKATVVVVKDDNQAKMERLERELAETKAKLQEKSDVLLEAESEAVIVTENPEYAALLAEGKSLFKGAHLIGKNLPDLNDRIPLLRKKIEDFKKAKMKSDNN